MITPPLTQKRPSIHGSVESQVRSHAKTPWRSDTGAPKHPRIQLPGRSATHRSRQLPYFGSVQASASDHHVEQANRSALVRLGVLTESGGRLHTTGADVPARGREVGKGLDELTPEQRKELLQMVVDEVIIDRDNNADITLAIPIEPESVAIASESLISEFSPSRAPAGD